MDDQNYKKRVEGEIRHYKSLYKTGEAKKKLSYETPEVWQKVENHVSNKILQQTGANGFVDYCIKFCLRKKRPVNLLSLGSGPCPMELNNIMPRLPAGSGLTALDINSDLLNLAKEKAKEKKVRFTPMVQDVNKLDLPENEFDLIICYASLHHFMELDHITAEINKALKSDGEFVTVDICSRNGYLLWPESKVVINAIFTILPEQYRRNYYNKTFDKEFFDKDYSLTSFECINSEAIIPALTKNLNPKQFIPMTSIARRFFDHMYGFNLDLNNPFDKTFVDFILNLDEECLKSGRLKPETFFGVYGKKRIDKKENIDPLIHQPRKEMATKVTGFFKKLFWSVN